MLREHLPTDHGGLEVLTFAECLELMAGEPVGRFAFIDRGEPIVLPVNHRVVGRSVVFRTTFGSKLEKAVMEAPATFEVDRFDPETRTGWSVLAKGTVAPVHEDDEIAKLEELGLEPWVMAVDRDHWVRLHLNEVTGRRIVRLALED